MLKAIFINSSGGKQLGFLVLLLLFGELVSVFLGYAPLVVFYGFDAELTDHPMMLRLAQLFSSVGTFLLPSLGLAYFCSKDMKRYLSLGPVPDVQMIVLIMISLFFLTLPISSIENLITQLLVFPDFMNPVLDWMKEMDLRSEKLVMLLLKDNDPFTLLLNLIVIAVAAGVCEEFFFRGALQRIIEKWTTNPHIVIWVAAFLFSAFHLQLYGFVSRVLLGAFLGYLLFWGGNIWIPVFAHFTNNAIAVLAMSSRRLQDTRLFTDEIASDELLPVALLSLASLLAFTYFCNRLRLRLAKKKV